MDPLVSATLTFICIGALLTLFLAAASKPRYKIIKLDENKYAISVNYCFGLIKLNYYLSNYGNKIQCADLPDLNDNGCIFTTATKIENVFKKLNPPKIKGSKVTLNQIKTEELIDG